MTFWQRRKLKKARAKCDFTGIAIVCRDGITQKNYWATANAVGEDVQSLTGGQSLDMLDPANLPVGARIELYTPKGR